VQQDFQILLEDYQVERILGTDMYQQNNAALAIQAGGMFGKLITGDVGPRASAYVPVVESDFIFSAIGEEFGFVGMLLIVGGYLLFAMTGLRIAQKAKDYLGSMIAIGITALVSVQAFVNIGVVTSLLPNTGIPLPFISSGLTALLCNLATIGILLNISLQPKRKEKERVIEITDYAMVR
jgi:rod shape determining protein RodA